MNTIIIILHIIIVLLFIASYAFQAATLKSAEECRKIDDKLITMQRELIEKQNEQIERQREYIEILEEEAQE